MRFQSQVDDRCTALGLEGKDLALLEDHESAGNARGQPFEPPAPRRGEQPQQFATACSRALLQRGQGERDHGIELLWRAIGVEIQETSTLEQTFKAGIMVEQKNHAAEMISLAQ